MKISARNQLKGTVSSVTEGAVNGIVAIDFGNRTIKSDITMEAIKDLGLAEGVSATAIIKASNVLIAATDKRIDSLSARNQFEGTVGKVEKGAVNGRVTVELEEGLKITASITNEAIESLGLSEGSKAVAIIKATDVMVAVD